MEHPKNQVGPHGADAQRLQVPAEIERLSNSVVQVINAADELVSRLTPVTLCAERPDARASLDARASSKEPDDLVPMADQIKLQRRLIESLAFTIGHAIKHLQV